MPFWMLVRVLVDVALEPDQHADRVLVGAAPDLVGGDVGLVDDPPALGLGGLDQARARR